MRHYDLKGLASAILVGAAGISMSCRAADAVEQIRYGDHVPTVHCASTGGARYWFQRVRELAKTPVCR